MTLRSCDSEVVAGPGIHERQTKAIARANPMSQAYSIVDHTYDVFVVGAR